MMRVRLVLTVARTLAHFCMCHRLLRCRGPMPMQSIVLRRLAIGQLASSHPHVCASFHVAERRTADGYAFGLALLRA